MAVLDMRSNEAHAVDTLIIGESDRISDNTAVRVVREKSTYDGAIAVIEPEDRDYGCVEIVSVEHARYLINALQYSIEHGWYEK